MTTPRTIRRLDHCVLPVGDLEVAAARLAQLGFTVAPVGHHPFGTANACVYFSDDTFLEPLAVADHAAAAAASVKGNVFTARDAAFRFRRGEDGFSAMVMASDDAAEDHRRFEASAISAGPMLRFSRKARDATGKSGEASFRLAFAADLRAPDAFFFTCERVAAPAIDRSGLQRHANGVTGIASVVMSETNPDDFRAFLEALTGQTNMKAHPLGLDAETANATVSVLNPAGMKARFATKASTHSRGLRLRAIVFTVTDLAHCEALLTSNEIEARVIDSCLVVAPAEGQGAIFAFEAQS